MRISILIGNPNARGRTSHAAELVARRAAEAVGAPEATLETVELADVASRLFERDDPGLAALCAQVASADLLIVASPTYKASFTGLLKAFLDRYGPRGLTGSVALPLMLGASPTHALAVETQLRPVLLELGASMPTRGLYLLDKQMEQLEAEVSAFMADAGPLLRRLLSPR
jgi:FMN reductase